MTLKKCKKGPEFDISKWKANKKAVPPEVWEKYGEFSIAENNGYLYGTVPKHLKPPYFTGRSVAISKLVWLIHNPGYRFAPYEKILYVNGDIQDNRIENLKVRE